MTRSERSAMSAWISLELERIWLGAEQMLRQLQRSKLRSATAPVMIEVEAMLTARRTERVALRVADHRSDAPGSTAHLTPRVAKQQTGEPPAFDQDELDRACARVVAELEAVRRPSADRLRARLGLTFSDIGALLVAAAPSLDPGLVEMFAALRGPAGQRQGVDVALIAQLLGSTREQYLKMLTVVDEQRAPVTQRWLQVAADAGPASHRTIQPTLDLVWLLGGDEARPSPSLERHAAVVHGVAAWDGLVLDGEVRASVEQLARRFAAGSPALPWLVLWGAPGSGKRTIAARLAAFAERPLLTVSPRGVDKSQLPELVRKAVRDAAWLGTALYVGPFGADELHDQPHLVHALESCAQPVFVGVEAARAPRVKTAQPLAELALPVPHANARLALWTHALAGATLAPSADLATIARGYKLTPGEIAASAREAAVVAGSGAVDGDLLRAVMERRLRNELGSVANRLTVNTTWDDVILPADAIARVRELIARKRHEDRVYREWGLDRRIGYGKGLVALFSGPPGTGKTLLAGVIARELGYELYQVDLSQIFSRWLGETEKALERVFDQAERAHAVLLFDEADALFAKRTEVEDSHDRYANVAVNYLLQRLERYSGVAVLTTNKDTYLDEALRRRLSLHLALEEPEIPERLRLWEKHLPADVPGSETVDVAGLAHEFELTGGYIKNVAVRATFLSAAENVPLTTAQVRRAAHLELEDLGRVITWPEELLLPPTPDAIDVLDYIEG